MTAADLWLTVHGLTIQDIESVGGSVSPGRLAAPVYSVGGQFVFMLYRSFLDDRKYDYKPLGCRTGAVLYGLHVALTACLERKQIILVEGFSDALALWKAGLPNVVALLGSHLSRMQLAQARLCGEIVVWADGDDAGLTAARLMQKRDPTIKVVAVRGMDPAELCTSGKLAATSIPQLATRLTPTVLNHG